MSFPATDWRGDEPGASASLRVPGPAGALEVLATCPDEQYAVAATAIVCHPHPLHGGTMNNKVVHTVARAFDALGARTLRFNFRGVGASEGHYDHGEGETDDLVTLLDWVHVRRPDDAIWLAGFSFGAYVALRASARWPVARLVAVAPPVNLYDFSAVPTPTCPCWVVQGGQDEIVPASAVHAWVEGLAQRPALIRLDDAGHFFHQRLNVLRGALTAAFVADA